MNKVKQSIPKSLSDHKICTKCILVEGFLGIKLNDQGLCNYCSNQHYENPVYKKVEVTNNMRERARKDWKTTLRIMQENSGNVEYDCVIGFSGGKDSTALVDTFVTKFGLNPRLITIDTGYMSDVAKANIQTTLSIMNLAQNHVFVEDAVEAFTQLYRGYFMHHESSMVPLTLHVCYRCTDLIHTILVKEALRLNVAYVIIGFSPDQISRNFYDVTSEVIIEDGTPSKELRQFYSRSSENPLKWYLTEDEKARIGDVRIIYPYHILDYDELEIIRYIEDKQLIKVGQAAPLKTNCYVLKTALMYDLLRYGIIPYAMQFSNLIRQTNDPKKQKRARKRWLHIYKRVGKLILKNRFFPKQIKLVLERLGLTKEELVKTIEIYRANDPNLTQILNNLHYLKTNQLH